MFNNNLCCNVKYLLIMHGSPETHGFERRNLFVLFGPFCDFIGPKLMSVFVFLM